MRKRDILNARKAEQMKNIFESLASGKRQPTQEGLSDDEEDGIPVIDAQSNPGNGAGHQSQGHTDPIVYREAADDGEESYYDEEEEPV